SLVARGTLLGDDAGSMNMIASKLLWQHGDDDDDVQHAASSTSRLKQRQEAMKRFKPDCSGRSNQRGVLLLLRNRMRFLLTKEVTVINKWLSL
uniref:Uncharacterized protein n=1 Tax=Parascaris univalens TaxID=6257 RepID=A0A915A969_PARUN